MNPEDAIKVLQKQIDKLEAKEFDLTSWKNFTILLLERIFGGTTQKITAIQNIKYDMSSWVLRDETGYLNTKEAVKRHCREILEEAIVELETFGMPEEAGDSIPFEAILSAMEDELTGSRMREIRKALADKVQLNDRKKILLTKLKSYGSDTSIAILVNILTHEKVVEQLKNDS